MKTYAFLIVHAKNDWIEISDDILKEMRSSGLWKELDSIFVFMDGDRWLEMDKTYLFNKKEDDYEFPALEKMHELAQTEEFRALYIHTKGSSKTKNDPSKENLRDWFKVMLWATVTNYKKCFTALEAYDACGANYANCKNGEHFPHHFSGNFWWANSSYIKTLPKPNRITPYSGFHIRHNAEFWIGENKNGKMYSIINTNTNHYHSRYPESLYKDKE